MVTRSAEIISPLEVLVNIGREFIAVISKQVKPLGDPEGYPQIMPIYAYLGMVYNDFRGGEFNPDLYVAAKASMATLVISSDNEGVRRTAGLFCDCIAEYRRALSGSTTEEVAAALGMLQATVNDFKETYQLGCEDLAEAWAPYEWSFVKRQMEKETRKNLKKKETETEKMLRRAKRVVDAHNRHLIDPLPPIPQPPIPE